MGSKGNAFACDDAAESFFVALKKKFIHRRCWLSRHEFSAAVFKYIEVFYNRDRRHVWG